MTQDTGEAEAISQWLIDRQGDCHCNECDDCITAGKASRAIRALAAERDALREALWRLVDACEACDWDDAFLNEARAALTGEAKP